MSKAHVKEIKTVEIGGNCMVEKYLMKLKFQNISTFAKHVLKWPRYYNIIHETIYMKV
jgi:hypothetical protein